MAIFHDEDDGPEEPIPGLPQSLPEGEHVVWQGRADGRALARHGFHIRSVAIYFGIAIILRSAAGAMAGDSALVLAQRAAMIGVFGAIGVALLILLAWAMARRSLFTITNKRVVLRHGVAFKKYINVPFTNLKSIDLKMHADGTGDLALSSDGKSAIPYFHLWPFARPMHFTRTVPLLRALPRPNEVAETLAEAVRAAAGPGTKISKTPSTEADQRPLSAPQLGAEASPS